MKLREQVDCTSSAGPGIGRPPRFPASRIGRLLRFTLLLAVAVLVSATAPMARPAQATLTNCTVNPDDVELDAQESAFLDKINEERQKKGVGPLQESPSLTRAATWMAIDAAINQWDASPFTKPPGLSHTDSKGRNVSQRLAECDALPSVNYYGENLLGGGELTDAQMAFDVWKASAGHYQNMIDYHFKTIGIARAYNPGGLYYRWFWVTDFSDEFQGMNYSLPAIITNPSDGTTFGGSSVLFARTDGIGVSEYMLNLGSAPDASDLYLASMPMPQLLVTGLPTDGRTVYARLDSQVYGGRWEYEYYVYEAAKLNYGVKATIVSPIPGSTLSDHYATFTRDAGVNVQDSGEPGTGYILWVGTAPGTHDIFEGYMASTSQLVTGLPTNGSTIYVRLSSYLSSGWQSADYTYIAPTVNNVNHAPMAYSQSVTLNEDNPAPLTLTGSDPDGDPLTFTVITQPSHGSLSGTAPNLTYTPAANYNGADSFLFKVNDGKINSNIATISITVNSSTASLKLAPIGPTIISSGDPMNFSLTIANPGGPLPSRFQLVLLPEFLGRELSLVTANVTLPSGTAGPIPLGLALPQNIQSLFPGDYSFIGRLLNGSGGLLSESRVDFTVPAKVSIGDFSFAPQLIVVRVGDNVQWTNNGATTHTTTNNSGVWSSGNLTPGASWDRVFTSEGSFPYHCALHPQMTGGVIALSGPLPVSSERAEAERRLKRGLKVEKLKKAIRRTLRP